MKKSKLLLPLMGLAGVATATMPIALTSCGKVETTAIDKEQGLDAWFIESQSVNTSTKYQYILNDSEGISITTLRTTFTVTMTNADPFLQPKVVKVNNQDLVYQGASASGKSHLYMFATVPTGKLTVTIKFAESKDDANIGFSIS